MYCGRSRSTTNTPTAMALITSADVDERVGKKGCPGVRAYTTADNVASNVLSAGIYARVSVHSRVLCLLSYHFQTHLLTQLRALF